MNALEIRVLWSLKHSSSCFKLAKALLYLTGFGTNHSRQFLVGNIHSISFTKVLIGLETIAQQSIIAHEHWCAHAQ